jgi:hypothetical protein
MKLLLFAAGRPVPRPSSLPQNLLLGGVALDKDEGVVKVQITCGVRKHRLFFNA